ncbi:MAG: class I SAM-dependent methyltransferase [Cyclobacteriaceae bacterium]
MDPFKTLLSPLFLTLVFSFPIWAQEDPPFVLDVPYVPTPDNVVEAILELANVSESDVLYDLGSGDGRIPIAAAKNHGAKAVGIELNPEHVRLAKTNVKKAGLGDKVKIIEGDIFKTDFNEATVLTLYLFPEINERLKPKIFKLKSGTRIVSHKYDMGDWQPEKTIKIKGPGGSDHVLYLWKVPAS